jgi:hypothetical protein
MGKTSFEVSELRKYEIHQSSTVNEGGDPILAATQTRKFRVGIEGCKLQKNSIILFEKTLIFTPRKEVLDNKRLPKPGKKSWSRSREKSSKPARTAESDISVLSHT